ncbi:MAG: hypothetical protein FWG99_00435 [Treponema sp.]|nr:hypothetical protein [Treponema sp.]
MKNFIIKIIFFSFFAMLLLSCEGLPINYSRSQSWLLPKAGSEEAQGKTWTTLCILNVSVDRTGGWDSVEKETAGLAPFYFWKRGCRVVSAGEAPVYAAEIQVREREFGLGWRTKRSLAVEVRIWAYGDAPGPDTAPVERKAPLAAGRVTAMGERSFSSSDTTGRLLSRAISKAARKLAVYERSLLNAN